MPAAPAPTIRPRWPAPPYLMINGTSPTSTKPPRNNIEDAEEQKTPSSVPQASYSAVTVAPAAQLPPPPTPRASIPTYAGSGAALLQDYCTDPAFTLLDGPTAVWVPVIGCISTKTECCATPTADDGAANNGPKPTGGSGGNPSGGVGGAGGGAQFPIAMLPSQGTLTGCPQDYHTVGNTACCPSSYWLWTTEIGGQVPCYSSLGTNLKPPPIPDTLADAGRSTREGASSGTITEPASAGATALTLNQKPTSAIVNIVYAMQYPMVDKADPGLSKGSKIGVGVGAAAGVAMIGILVWFFVRRCLGKKKPQGEVTGTSVSQRFGSQIDMSRVAHEPAGMARTHEGVRYTGVSTRAVNF